MAIGGFGLSGTVSAVRNPVMVARLAFKPSRSSDTNAIRQSSYDVHMAQLIAEHLDRDNVIHELRPYRQSLQRQAVNLNA